MHRCGCHLGCFDHILWASLPKHLETAPMCGTRAKKPLTFSDGHLGAHLLMLLL